jgi:hypothetical protein
MGIGSLLQLFQLCPNYNEILTNRKNTSQFHKISQKIKKNCIHINSNLNGTIIVKKLDLSRNDTCPISYEKITQKNKYMTCHICHYNFLFESLSTWLIISENCPLCISKWKSKEIYVEKYKKPKLLRNKLHKYDHMYKIYCSYYHKYNNKNFNKYHWKN